MDSVSVGHVCITHEVVVLRHRRPFEHGSFNIISFVHKSKDGYIVPARCDRGTLSSWHLTNLWCEAITW